MGCAYVQWAKKKKEKKLSYRQTIFSFSPLYNFFYVKYSKETLYLSAPKQQWGKGIFEKFLKEKKSSSTLFDATDKSSEDAQ